MNDKGLKFLFTSGGILIIFGVVTLLFVFSGPSSPSPSPTQSGTPPIQTNSGFDVFGNAQNPISGTEGSFDQNLNQFIKPFEPIASPIIGGGSSGTGGGTTGAKPLSDKEIFDELFPNFYIVRLKNIQKQLANVGWITPSASQITLSSEKDIYAFLGASMEALIQHGAYPDAGSQKVARDSIHIHFPALIEQKKRLLREPQAALWQIFDIKNPRPLIGYDQNLRDLLAGAFPFFPEQAHAQGINVSGIWETSDTCFKGINTAQTNPGKDLYSFCCNCGIKFYGYIPVFMTDCGPFAGQDGNTALCDVHLGCLNETCEGYNNAIWDGVFPPTTGNVSNYTFKCGCDDPEKTNQGGSEGGGGTTGM